MEMVPRARVRSLNPEKGFNPLNPFSSAKEKGRSLRGKVSGEPRRRYHPGPYPDRGGRRAQRFHKTSAPLAKF